jgi:hypothetical protein
MVRDQYSVGIPYALADGQDAHWRIPLDQSKTWIKELCDNGFIRTPDDVKTLLFRAHTSHGETLVMRPEESLRCTGSDYLDTVLQLRPPFAWHKPDGLRGVT